MAVNQVKWASMACPLCHQALKAYQFSGVEVDVCFYGCGVWLDVNELSRVETGNTLAAIDEAFEGVFTPSSRQAVKAQLAQTGERHCPKDGNPMQRHEWNFGSGIVMDNCPQCHGIWLDGGELEGYAEHVKKFRAHPPELTPEIKSKLMAVQQDFEQQWTMHLNDSARKVIRWDAWLLDDLVREVIQTTVNKML